MARVTLVQPLKPGSFEVLHEGGCGVKGGRGSLEEIDEAFVQLVAHK